MEALLHTDPQQNLVDRVTQSTLGVQFGPLEYSPRSIGNRTIFRVNGIVKLKIIAVCITAFEGDTATLSMGFTNDNTAIISVTTAADIDVNEIWSSTSVTDPFADFDDINEHIVNGENVIIDIATAALTAGTMQFYAYYEPISKDGKVSAP